jgi:hypothetical protein
MSFLAVIGLIILVGILVLLVVPWRIRLNGRADHQNGLSYTASLDWALGGVRIAKADDQPWALYILGLPVARFYEFPKPKKKKKKKKEKKSSPLAFAGIIRRDHQTMVGILGRMAKAAFLRGYLQGRIGISDPADIAQVALLCRLARLRSRRFNLTIDYVYDEEVAEINTNVGATLIIGYLLLSAGMLLLDSQTRMVLRSLRHA